MGVDMTRPAISKVEDFGAGLTWIHFVVSVFQLVLEQLVRCVELPQTHLTGVAFLFLLRKRA